MSDCKKCRTLFSDLLYGELESGQKQFLENHLQDCPKCKSELDELTAAVRFMEGRIRPEQGQSFWDDYWCRLTKRMKKENVFKPIKEKWLDVLIRRMQIYPRWTYQSAAAIVLIVIGIFIGRVLFSPSVINVSHVISSEDASQIGPDIQLIQRTHDYIERSKLMLLAVVNFDPVTEDPFVLDLPYQQQVSRELVQEAGWLKKELAGFRQRRMQELIVDLEVILLQIANLESEPDMSVIKMIKDGVESRGILLKMNLADIRRSSNKKNKSKSF